MSEGLGEVFATFRPSIKAAYVEQGKYAAVRLVLFLMKGMGKEVRLIQAREWVEFAAKNGGWIKKKYF